MPFPIVQQSGRGWGGEGQADGEKKKGYTACGASVLIWGSQRRRGLLGSPLRTGKEKKEGRTQNGLQRARRVRYVARPKRISGSPNMGHPSQEKTESRKGSPRGGSKGEARGGGSARSAVIRRKEDSQQKKPRGEGTNHSEEDREIRVKKVASNVEFPEEKLADKRWASGKGKEIKATILTYKI